MNQAHNVGGQWRQISLDLLKTHTRCIANRIDHNARPQSRAQDFSSHKLLSVVARVVGLWA